MPNAYGHVTQNASYVLTGMPRNPVNARTLCGAPNLYENGLTERCENVTYEGRNRYQLIQLASRCNTAGDWCNVSCQTCQSLLSQYSERSEFSNHWMKSRHIHNTKRKVKENVAKPKLEPHHH